MPDTVTVKVKDLERCHPEYDRYAKYWSQIKILVEGGPELALRINDYLRMRWAEPVDEYNARCKNFVHVDVLGGIGWYGAKIFKGQPQLIVSQPAGKDGKPGAAVDGSEGKFYQDFIANCDRGGTPIHRFYADVFLDALLYRRSWWATDKKNLGNLAQLTLKDYKAAGGDRPYLVRLPALNVTNWDTNEAGELEWALIRTETCEHAFLQPDVDFVDWYYFDRVGYRHYRAKMEDATDPKGVDVTATLVDEGPHALTGENRVPIRKMELPRSLWLANRAFNPAVEHLNKINELSFGLTMGCLIMPVYTSNSEVKPKVGEATMIKLAQGDSFGWSEPKGEVFKIAAEHIQKLEQKIDKLIYLTHQGREGNAPRQMMSGVAMQEDQRPANEILEAFGGITADAIRNTNLDIVAARGEDFVIELKGFDFVVDIGSARLDKIISVLDQDLGSATLETELKIELALDSIPNASQATKELVIAEIKAAPTAEEKAQAEADALEATRITALEGLSNAPRA